MKQFIQIVMVVTLLAVSLMVLSCATSGPAKSKDGLFEYAKEDQYGGISILAYNGNEKELIIPEKIDGKKVTVIRGSLGSNLRMIGPFMGKNLKKVTIPEGVVEIWDNAFADNLLTDVIIPASVKRLSGFNGNQLTSIVIPPNVTRINGFFDNPLTSITFTGLVSGDIVFDGSLGDLTPLYAANNRQPGVYTLNEDVWEFNGIPINNPAVIIMPDNVAIITIDGKNAQLMHVGALDQGRLGLRKRYCFIPEGEHNLVLRCYTIGEGWKKVTADITVPKYNFISLIAYEIKLKMVGSRAQFELGIAQ